MNRIKHQPKVTYDTNVLIYYCFSTKEHEIRELTSKTHRLTEFLIKNNSKILIPKFIVDELNNITFSKIVSDYISKKIELTNLPKNPSFLLKLELESKIRKKFNNFLNKRWVFVKDYKPSDSLRKNIKKFFDNLESHPKKQKFLNLKKRDVMKPSDIDIDLIGFSKEMGSVLVSNDYDLTFFAEELYEKNLSNHIYRLMDLNIYNN